MGRRNLPQSPNELRKAISKAAQSATLRGTINVARWRAQLHEEEMVQLLVNFALDGTQSASLRRDCAKDVLEIARGKIVAQVHDGENVDPTAHTGGASAIGQQIEAQRIETNQWQTLDAYVGKIASEYWPEHIRHIAGDLVALYSETTQD